MTTPLPPCKSQYLKPASWPIRLAIVTYLLCLLDGFLNPEDQVGTARADVRSKNITAIALFSYQLGGTAYTVAVVSNYFIMNSQSKPNFLIAHLCRVSKAIHSEATWKVLVNDRVTDGGPIPIGGKKSLMSPLVISSG